MNFTINFPGGFSLVVTFDDLTTRLVSIEKKLEDLMAVAQDLQALITAMNEATNRVAARLDAVIQGLKNSMTDAELAAVTSGIQAEIDRLNTLGANPAQPIPPEPPPVTP